MQPTPMPMITAATRDEAKPEAGPLPVPIAANSPDLNNDPDDTHDTDPVVQRIKERIALALSRSKQDSTTAALKSAPAQPGPEIRPTHEGPASSPPQSPITAPPENRRERLLRNEAIIERTLHTKDEMAMALLIILTEKLYKETHAAAGVYLKERWGFSRSRGYQLVRHARLLVQSRQQGQSAPANERQSRRLSADGTPLKNQPKNSSYEERFQRVKRHLTKQLRGTFAGEPHRFVQDLRQLLQELEQTLGTPTPAQPPASTLTYPQGRPVPIAGLGCVLGISREEARKAGYAK